MDSEPVALEAAQLVAPLCALLVTVPETVNYPSSRNLLARLKKETGYHHRHCPQVLSNGATHDVMSGDVKAVVTIHSVEEKGQDHVDG